MKASLLHRNIDQTGEAATWLDASETFLWVDIDRAILHEYVPATGRYTDHLLPDLVTTIIPFRLNEVILSLKGSLVRYQLDTKVCHTLTPLLDTHPEWRPNDGKASPEGRIWIGMMHLSNHQFTGGLYCVERDLSIRQVLSAQCIPNGIVWNKAGDRMYYADSGRGCIEAYAYNSSTGEIQFLRTAIQIPPEYGVPDGMTIDANNRLWVAHWGGYGVYVWDPETGLLVDKVEVPAPNVASCTFGGKDGRQLFITTARAGLTTQELLDYPLSGSLFIAETAQEPGINHYLYRESTP